MIKRSIYFIVGFIAIGVLVSVLSPVFAEQSGSSPESGTTSYIKTAYDWLVAKGANYGATDAADWTNSWGTYWDRIMEAAAWEPDGTGTVGNVTIGDTFYSGNNNRTIQTGTLYQNWELQDYDDLNCTNNNGETNTACSAGDSDYTGEESTWTLKASGGTAASVTDNSVTISLTSNKVYQDGRTKLYWSDRAATGIDNEFVFIDGSDRTTPAGNSCNFTTTGNANAYCDNQDPTSGFTEDNDVSAQDFCLNLALDADNADADSNGTTGTETDWRVPTQKELLQAYIDGAGNNLPNANNTFWSSTERNTTQADGLGVNLATGTTGGSTKNVNNTAICVRR